MDSGRGTFIKGTGGATVVGVTVVSKKKNASDGEGGHIVQKNFGVWVSQSSTGCY